MKLFNIEIKLSLRTFTVIASFVLGWAITIAGFVCPPQGEVDDSVLIILGQSLAYTAVGVGLKDYVDVQFTKIKKFVSTTETTE